MDRIEKFLKKLSPRERIVVKDVVERILQGNLAGLNVKKLRGVANEFRVRKGSVRIIFYMSEGELLLRKIERRGDATY